jgi:hypothetical protein
MIYEGVPFMPLARRDRMLADAKLAHAKQVGCGFGRQARKQLRSARCLNDKQQRPSSSTPAASNNKQRRSSSTPAA